MVIGPVVEKLWNDALVERHAELIAQHIPHSMKALDAVVELPAWQDVAYNGRVYIKCLLDQTIPIKTQEHSLTESGVERETWGIEVGHCAFHAQP